MNDFQSNNNFGQPNLVKQLKEAQGFVESLDNITKNLVAGEVIWIHSELDGTKHVKAALEGVEEYRIEAIEQLIDAILQALPEETSIIASKVKDATMERTWGKTEGYNQALTEVRHILNEARKTK